MIGYVKNNYVASQLFHNKIHLTEKKVFTKRNNLCNKGILFCQQLLKVLHCFEPDVLSNLAYLLLKLTICHIWTHLEPDFLLL